MGSPGVFYYVDFDKLSVPLYLPGPGDTAPKFRDPKMLEVPHGESLQTATHGTSVGAAVKIIADGCFTEALNRSGGKHGVYCEGAQRKHCTAFYSTMNFAANDPVDLNLYSCFFELAVNKAVGTSTGGQWVQPPDSIIIAGMHLHCLPVTKLYSDGLIGWCTVANTVLDRIRTHKFLRGRAAGADQGIRYPTPGRQRTMS